MPKGNFFLNLFPVVLFWKNTTLLAKLIFFVLIIAPPSLPDFIAKIQEAKTDRQESMSRTIRGQALWLGRPNKGWSTEILPWLCCNPNESHGPFFFFFKYPLIWSCPFCDCSISWCSYDILLLYIFIWLCWVLVAVCGIFYLGHENCWLPHVSSSSLTSDWTRAPCAGSMES